MSVTDSISHPELRYIFVKGEIQGRKLMLANIYCPKVCDILFTFKEGSLIMGRDFKVPLNPLIDTSSGSTFLPFQALKCMKADLISLDLHNAWRTLYPSTKDFTFFQHPQQRYSSIDYLFISQIDISSLQSSSIEPMVISDHHPITISLTVRTFNPWIVTDPIHKQELERALTDNFELNTTTDVPPPTTWEAQKCGKPFALYAKIKMIQQQKIKELIDKISSLELTYKRTRAQVTLSELTNCRTLLLEELGKRYKRRLVLSQKAFYKGSDKCGRMLARRLRNKHSSNIIHSIKDPDGTIHHALDKIACIFKEFYCKLYNLSPLNSPSTVNDHRAHRIQ